MENLNLIQQITVVGFLLVLGLFFLGATYKRGRVALGNVLTTILPAGIFIYLVFILKLQFATNESLQILGVTLLVLGIFLNKLSITHLGWTNSDDFWWSKKSKKNRTLVTTGPYKYIRHPIALSLIIAYGGLILIYSHTVALVVYIVSVLFVIYTSFAEEKFIQGKFPEYRDYKQKTGMFLPRL
jgi:protein-S-isoprenylcysteine O-methyltransferase Ste14